MVKNFKWLLTAALVQVLIPACLLGQTANPLIRGQVTDPSGASVPAATVTATGPGGATLETQTDEQGRYIFRHLAPGTYTVRIHVKGFAPFEKAGIEIAAGEKAQVVNAQLAVHIEREQVTVQSEAQQLSVSPENNASALVLKGKDLKALSDDPNELQQELQALAGPAAGPNGGQIYIDGFSGGQLPPKDAILEVRVNQNPFSAQYRRLGYGRIDIITKPGYQKFHGSIFGFGNNSMFNSRNPFVSEEPNYHSEFFAGNVGGPLGKKASFMFSIFHMTSIGNSIINTQTLDPTTFVPTPYSAAVRSPQGRTHYHPRVDFQLTPKNVLTVRGEFSDDSSQNQGIGQMTLQSMAFNSSSHGNEIHIGDTQVVSDRTVTQTLFGYESDTSTDTPFSIAPTVNVIGAFTSGGQSGGVARNTVTHLQLRNTTSMMLDKHSLTYGAELQNRGESVNSFSGFNGTFTFPTLTAYQITAQGLAQGLTPDQIRAAGGEPSQFAITGGNPAASTGVTDLALFAEDTWRLRPNVSLTYGLRFETQNHISDHADFAPRLGLAWGLGKGAHPQTVLRAGFGIFYDRFATAQVLHAEQLNGINQQRYIVAPPDAQAIQLLNLYPAVPTLNDLGAFAGTQNTYRIDPNLRAPYTMQAAVSIERQITQKITTSVTYINSHGVHQLLSNNINAPLPGTYVACAPGDTTCTPSPGVRPFGDVGNIYQYESVGIFNESQIIANFNVNQGSNISFSGYYTLSYANSDTSGAGSFPMDPYNIGLDYGPAAFAVRNQFFLRAFIGLPWGFQFSPFMMATSGHPYNVTVGQDLNGDSIYNDRPALAAPGATGSNIVATSLGKFNIDPASGQAVVPINYLVGPGQFNMFARISKTFGFGKVTEGGGMGGGHWHRHGGGLGGRGLSSSSGGSFWGHGNAENHRFQVEVGAMAHNVLNRVNLGTPVGNVTSPLFGQSISLAGGFFGGGSANRSINFFMRFSF
jgi:Carboxypeptidase regulatory-like domain/TonB dependent receptor-like, beta-barrel